MEKRKRGRASSLVQAFDVLSAAACDKEAVLIVHTVVDIVSEKHLISFFHDDGKSILTLHTTKVVGFFIPRLASRPFHGRHGNTALCLQAPDGAGSQSFDYPVRACPALQLYFMYVLGSKHPEPFIQYIDGGVEVTVHYASASASHGAHAQVLHLGMDGAADGTRLA